MKLMLEKTRTLTQLDLVQSDFFSVLNLKKRNNFLYILKLSCTDLLLNFLYKF
jgi:hypothetical protein